MNITYLSVNSVSVMYICYKSKIIINNSYILKCMNNVNTVSTNIYIYVNV